MTASYIGSGRGKSLRALKAEEEGRVPWSKLPASLKRGLTARQAEQIWPTREWHHTGKFANRTRYYDPEHIKDFWAAIDATGVDINVLMQGPGQTQAEGDVYFAALNAVSKHMYEADCAREALITASIGQPAELSVSAATIPSNPSTPKIGSVPCIELG